MKKFVPLADILWYAANFQLWEGVGPKYFDNGRYSIDEYSCCAVINTPHLRSAAFAEVERVKLFLKSLGCPVNSCQATFGTFDNAERQQRRYMWLLLVMHVAEDEGIMVEIPFKKKTFN